MFAITASDLPGDRFLLQPEVAAFGELVAKGLGNVPPVYVLKGQQYAAVEKRRDSTWFVAQVVSHTMLITQWFRSLSMVVLRSSAQGYCRKATIIPALCKSLKLSQTSC